MSRWQALSCRSIKDQQGQAEGPIRVMLIRDDRAWVGGGRTDPWIGLFDAVLGECAVYACAVLCCVLCMLLVQLAFSNPPKICKLCPACAPSHTLPVQDAHCAIITAVAASAAASTTNQQVPSWTCGAAGSTVPAWP